MNTHAAIHRVLLVDDDDNLRFLTQTGLEGMTDWEIEPASSGQEALEKAERCTPDVVLMDMMMPGMDGTTTMRKMREHPQLKDVPIIFLTAKVQVREKEQYLKLGATGVIVKPFDPITLCDEIQSILRSRKC